MARSKNLRVAESEAREPHTDGGSSESEPSKNEPDAEATGDSYLTQISNYFMGSGTQETTKTVAEDIEALAETFAETIESIAKSGTQATAEEVTEEPTVEEPTVEEPTPEPKGEEFYFLQVYDYFRNKKRTRLQMEKCVLIALGEAIEGVNSDFLQGRATIFDNDTRAPELTRRDGMVGDIYVPFDCVVTHIQVLQFYLVNLQRWDREGFGIRCAGRYETHVFAMPDEYGQWEFKPTGEVVPYSDLIQYLDIDKKEDL